MHAYFVRKHDFARNSVFFSPLSLRHQCHESGCARPWSRRVWDQHRFLCIHCTNKSHSRDLVSLLSQVTWNKIPGHCWAKTKRLMVQSMTFQASWNHNWETCQGFAKQGMREGARNVTPALKGARSRWWCESGLLLAWNGAWCEAGWTSGSFSQGWCTEYAAVCAWIPWTSMVQGPPTLFSSCSTIVKSSWARRSDARV